MSEFDLLSSIADIITRNLLNEDIHDSKWNSLSQSNTSSETLLKPSDDEDLEFYLRHQFGHCNGYNTLATPKISTNYNKSRKKKCVDVKKSSNNNRIKEREIGRKKLMDVDLLNKFDNIAFEDYLHMSKLSFLKIFQFIRSILESIRLPNAISPQTVFSIAVWKLTTDEDFEGISRRFFIPLNECRLLIKEFCRIISENYETYIRWPNSLLSQRLQLSGFQQHANLKIFTDLFGIITLKCLNIFLIEDDAEFPIIFQIVCNADLKIVDCFVELKQNYRFDKSPMGQLLSNSANSNNGLPKDGYLIGNSCFPLYHYLIRPFVAPQTIRENEFNDLLQTGIDVAQEAIDIMAKRFNILYALEANNLTEVRQLLESVCALHNLSIAIEDDYVERKQHLITYNWPNDMKSYTDLQISNENAEAQHRRYELMDILLPI